MKKHLIILLSICTISFPAAPIIQWMKLLKPPLQNPLTFILIWQMEMKNLQNYYLI